jgi:hypothetical protein
MLACLLVHTVYCSMHSYLQIINACGNRERDCNERSQSMEYCTTIVTVAATLCALVVIISSTARSSADDHV